VKRILIATLAAGAVAAALSGPAAAGTSRTTLKLKKTGVGTILVNGRGFTVYAFSKDGRNRDACAAISGCLSLWPVVGGGDSPILGPGVKRSLVGTTIVKGGKKQLTYGGHPLYTYVGDSGPGQTSYVNFSQFGGRWPAVNAAGRDVK
jgi:predicted lipoprotein with Yx(FWY)xxD motif